MHNRTFGKFQEASEIELQESNLIFKSYFILLYWIVLYYIISIILYLNILFN
jgi:hypothetical protein